MRVLVTLLLASAVGGAPVTLSAQSASDSLSTAADKGRIIGSDKAPIWLLIVSDYQCPFCRDWHDKTWAAIRNEYVTTGKIRVAYVHFPLGQHPNARATAIAAMCASVQGKFWPMTELLFKTQDRWKDLKDPRPFVDSLVRVAGVDAARHKRCMDAPAVAALVEADRVRMARAGTESTPTFFIGAKRLAGALPIEEFRRAIDAELAAAKKPR
jgi:protein-disulfide isomerase